MTALTTTLRDPGAGLSAHTSPNDEKELEAVR